MSGIALIGAIGAALGATPLDQAMCRVVRFAADGGRTEHPPTRPYVRPSPSGVSASSSSSGPGSSSVSVSSRSSGDESVSRIVQNGRSITTTYDSKGCTIVIDDRPAQGD
jgi:hypothetical protein